MCFIVCFSVFLSLILLAVVSVYSYLAVLFIFHCSLVCLLKMTMSIKTYETQNKN